MPRHECGSCTTGWSPSRRTHCSLCGENFSVVGHFDKHLDKNADPLTCKQPADIGLVKNARGVWVLPGEEDISERLRG